MRTPVHLAVLSLCCLALAVTAQVRPNPKSTARYGDPDFVGQRISFACRGCTLPDIIQGILVKAGVRSEFPDAQQWQRVADTVVVQNEPWNYVLDTVLARYQLQATWSDLGRLVISRRMLPVATGPGKFGQLLFGLPPLPANVANLNTASRAVEAERFFKEGIGHFLLANPDDARIALIRFAWATRIFDEIEYGGREASALYMLGAAFLDLGQTAKAREAFQRARDVGQNTGNQRIVLLAENQAAYVDLLEGRQPQEARQAATAGFSHVQHVTAHTNLSGRPLLDRKLDAMLATAAGRIFFRLGDIEAAHQAFKLGFAEYLTLEEGARGVIENAVWLEQTARQLGRRAEAEQALETVRALQQAVRASRLYIAYLSWTGVVYADVGDLKKAVELQRAALDALRELPDRTLETGVQWNLARMQTALRNYAEARRSYEAVLQLNRDTDSFWRQQVQEVLAQLP